jgi:hypothetical protein
MKQVTLSPKIWLTLRFLAFPLAVLLPFFLIRYNSAHCYSTPHSMGLSIDSGPAFFGLLAWLLIGVFLIASFMQQNTKENRNEQRSFITKQLIVSAISIVVTYALYVWMRAHSQVTGVSVWCDSANHLHGSLPNEPFGVGLAPVVVHTMAVLYLVVPTLKFYMIRFSRSRVSGIKKKDLFQ